MEKSGETSFGSVKSGRRLSSRSSPGHLLSSSRSLPGRRLSTRSARGESPVARRPKPSHATIRQAPVGNPFEVALNLVMKVRPMENDKFEMEPLELCLNDKNVLPKDQKKKVAFGRKSSAVSPRAFFGAVEPGYQSDYESDDSVFLPCKAPATPNHKDSETSSHQSSKSPAQQKQQAVVAAASGQKASSSMSLDASPCETGSYRRTTKALIKKGAELTGEQHKHSLGSCLRLLDCPHPLPRRSSSNISASSTVSQASSKSGSRSSRRSSKDSQKKANKTIAGDRYKNKKSLLRFSSLEKPRSKSVGGNPPGFELYPRPRPLNFDDSAAPDATINSVGVDHSMMNKTFYHTLDSIVQPTRLNFNESPEAAGKSRTALLSVSTASMNSTQNATFDFATTVNRTQLLNGTGVDKSMGPNGETKNILNAIPACLVASPAPGQSPLAFVAVVPKNVSFQVPANNAIVSASMDSTASKNPLDSTTSFSNVDQQEAVACDVGVGQQKKEGFLHKRSMRLGFIVNGVPMAVNLTLNFRSEDEKLYVEPIELLYDGQKMWRRSARQITKEIHAQLAADKKKTDALKASIAAQKKAPVKKSILKNPSVSESGSRRTKSPKQKSPGGKAGTGTSPKPYY